MNLDTNVSLSYKTIPLIPLRGVCIFPGMRLTFELERPASLLALEAAMKDDQIVFLTAQRDASEEEPSGEDGLERIGAVCRVLQVLRVPDEEAVRVMAEGLTRGALVQLTKKKPYRLAVVEELDTPFDNRAVVKAEALIRQCYGLFEEYARLVGLEARDVFVNIIDSEDPGFIADHIAQNIYMRHGQKQLVLDELRPLRRIALVNRMLRRELDIIQVEQSLHESTAEQLGRVQREMFLREQLKAIQMELGDEEGDEIDEYRDAVARLKAPDEVREKLAKEVSRLAKQPFGSAEAALSLIHI